MSNEDGEVTVSIDKDQFKERIHRQVQHLKVRRKRKRKIKTFTSIIWVVSVLFKRPCEIFDSECVYLSLGNKEGGALL